MQRAHPDADSDAAPVAPAAMSLAALSAPMLLASLGTSIANVALPTLVGSFAAPFQAVQWVVLAYLLAVTTLVIGVGRVGDLVGRRRLMLAGLGLFTMASALSAIAPTLGLLVGARALQGFGAAVMMVLAVALVGETVPKQKTGSAMGLLGTLSAVGTALGPSLGGVLIEAGGWRAIFAAMIPLGLGAFALAVRGVPKPTGAAAPPAGIFDGFGMAILATTLAAYALAATLGGGSFGIINGALLAAAVLGAIAFAVVESRSASPLVPIPVLQGSGFAAALGANALVSAVMMATLVVGPFYLSGGLGLGAAAVGLAMSVGPVVSIATGLPAGRLVDRFGPAAITLAGLGLMAVGATGLAALPRSMGVEGYVIAILALTPGYQLFQSANNTAVMTAVPADRRGVVSGILALSRNLGLVTGAAVLGALFAWAAGPAADPSAVVFGMHVTFAAAVVGILAAATLIWAARVARGAVATPG